MFPVVFYLENLFLSTLSLRRATILCMVSVQIGGFLSTLSLRRATLRDLCDDMYLVISIHALLAESDSSRHIGKARSKHFYPRSPCGERRL